MSARWSGPPASYARIPAGISSPGEECRQEWRHGGPEARSPSRLVLLLVCCGVLMGADPAEQVLDLFASTASALANRSVSAFINGFDPAMQGYADLRTNVDSLLKHSVLESSIDPVSNEGDERVRTVELDWTLRIVDANDPARITRREQRVTCRVEKNGKKWRITSFAPMSLFTPPGG